MGLPVVDESFVLFCDLILDENLCDYHCRFMRCRGQLNTIHSYRFNGEISDAEQRNAQANPATRHTALDPLKMWRVAHIRNGNESVLIAAGPRFLASSFYVSFIQCHTNGRFPFVSFFAILLFIYDFVLYYAHKKRLQIFCSRAFNTDLKRCSVRIFIMKIMGIL